MISRSFLNFNLSKNNLENNEYNNDDRDNAIDLNILQNLIKEVL